MEIPDLERPNTRRSSMGKGEGQQPLVSRPEGAEAGQEVESQQQAVGVQGVEKKPDEIQSVEACSVGVSSSNANVDMESNKAAVTRSSSLDRFRDAGPSFSKVETSPEEAGTRIDSKEDISLPLDERSAGARGGTGSVGSAMEGDPPRQQQEAKDPSSREGAAAAAQSADTPDVQYLSPGPFVFPKGFPLSEKSGDSHHIDIPPLRTSSKLEELDSYKRFAIARTCSNFSRASAESAMGDRCRICQEHTDEPLMELGCHCRGELAKAHRTCIDHWFGNKGTNKCEVCQRVRLHSGECYPLLRFYDCHPIFEGSRGRLLERNCNEILVCLDRHVATNVPPPSSQPTPHFWVWRIGGPYNANPRRAGGVGPYRFNPLPMRPVLLMTLRRHPTILLLWLLLFAFMAYLFVDVTGSTTIGYAAMPIGFLFGVLVVLGLGTAARLVLECWHERVIRRNIRRMEEEPNFDEFPLEQTNIDIQTEPAEGQAASNLPSEGTTLHSPPEASPPDASVTASVAATAAPDEVNR